MNKPLTRQQKRATMRKLNDQAKMKPILEEMKYVKDMDAFESAYLNKLGLRSRIMIVSLLVLFFAALIFSLWQ